jgi:hypothetical protein
MLNRELRVQEGKEEVFVGGRHALPRWDYDTAYGGLGLSVSRIEGLVQRRVLDAASGLSILATELSILGVVADCVDIEIDDAHPSLQAAAAHVRERYSAELTRLCELVDSGAERYVMSVDERRLLARLVGHAPTVASRYPAVSGKRIRDDVTALSSIEDATYDAALCGWLMVHLEEADERRAIESLVRVTKPGGHVHVRAGYGGDAAERIRDWLGDRVAIERGEDDLVVMRRLA